MPYFRLLVITFCFVVSQFCHGKDNDINKRLLSVDDQKIFNLALKEGNKAANKIEQMECEGEDCGNEGFAVIEGNENMMKNAANMMKALGDGKKGVENAQAIEKMINNMGGISGVLQAFGSMNQS